MRFLNTLALLISVFFLSANLNLETSAAQKKGFLRLNILSRQYVVDLNSSQVHALKTREGFLKELSFSQLNDLFQITFYPQFPYPNEKLKTVKTFTWLENQLVLNGAMLSYTEAGQLHRELWWKNGRLSGPYRIYNEAGRKLEERSYDNGLPVGEWTVYYPNGQKACEVTFPHSQEVWLSTLVASSSKRSHLAEMRPHRPYQTTEVWYYENGAKQKELTYLIYFKDRKQCKTELIAEKSFDLKGVLVENNTTLGKREAERNRLLGGLFEEVVDQIFIDEQLFKESRTTLYKEAGSTL
ncbi:MAG: hypothetical protein K0S07_1125 [Chlamydiales bacterium]|jgi:antitoxin component YwqK of YwqJK toxin-antitoxin module|nr:hypothetical protein [Chlamydiales bacterium]